MIHRESRNRLALALRRYVSGHITNDDLDDVEVDWRDRGAVAVKEMAWNLYGDMHSHRVGNDLPRGSEVRRSVARWITFLLSESEYFWPEYSFIQFVNWPLNVLTLGCWERRQSRRWKQFLEAGDFSVWPFCSDRDYDAVLAAPVLLSGGRAEQTAAADARKASRKEYP